MSNTLTDKLSRAAKPVTDAAKSAVNSAKTLYAQGKALMSPLDNEAKSMAAKNANVNQYKAAQPQAQPNSYKKGGKVKKTGQAKVHKGERVLTTKQSRTFEKKGGFRKLYGK